MESAHDAARDAMERFDAVARALARSPRLASTRILRPHPLLLLCGRGAAQVLLFPAPVWDRGRHLLRPFAGASADGELTWVVVGDADDPDLDAAIARGLSAALPERPTEKQLVLAVLAAFELVDARMRAETRGKWLSRYRYELGELIEIGKAVSTGREIDKLLGLVLEKSRFITGADAGSIYVVEGDDPDPLKRTLRFKLTQNDSLDLDFREFTLPISPRSMSGYVALHKSPLNIADVYDLPAHSPLSFDRSFDAKISYRTKSMLCAPMLDRRGDVIGVIQLINKKIEPEQRLSDPDDVESRVIPFDQRSEELVMTLASQAGIALESAILYTEINRMLEGFVRASVEAIEQRDPTTSGHSRRVADLTVSLARAVERSGGSKFDEVRFTRDDLRELEYASLLHDFGKIGVREEVLVKAKKLYEHELHSIRQRFDLAIRAMESETLRRKIFALERRGDKAELALLDEELERRRAELEGHYAAIVAANEPTIMTGGDFQRIEAIARETFVALDGAIEPLLSKKETGCLCVSRGSLTSAEIDEIRSHVVHTFQFLSQIPWGKQFRRVALIAGAHHEQLERHGLSESIAIGGDSSPVEDDEHCGHLRCADRVRPALQEGRADRARPRHSRLRGQRPAHRRGPFARVRRCAGMGGRASAVASIRPSLTCHRRWGVFLRITIRESGIRRALEAHGRLANDCRIVGRDLEHTVDFVARKRSRNDAAKPFSPARGNRCRHRSFFGHSFDDEISQSAARFARQAPVVPCRELDLSGPARLFPVVERP